MLKIITVVGTRPELIKMSRVIAEFDQHTNHILVHTGQNSDYELNQIFFHELKIRKPDYFLNAASTTPALTIAKIIEKSDEVFAQENPDALLIYGDTNSCLCVIPAKRRKIPVFHMEAGNRCFDERVPEELNRKVIDHLSDINLVLSEHARNYLLREGIAPDRIIKTGSHMQEVLNYFHEEITSSKILEKLNLEDDKYFLISSHREENVDSKTNLESFLKLLESISREYDLPIIISTHPRTQRRLQEFNLAINNERIKFLKPFGFYDYIKLQHSAFCILSDSGTITEEASLLNLPAITIRQTHERPEGMDEASIIMVDYHKNPENILNTIKVIRAHHNTHSSQFNLIQDYNVNNVSKKILRIVLSYKEFVKRTVWHE